VATREASSRVSLREISSDNLHAVLGLSVTDQQREVYPRSNGWSIAEGHYPPDDDLVWMRAIYAGDTPVGFMMTSEAGEQGKYFLWRLMIDADHQGRGYGFEALAQLIARISDTPNPEELITSHLKGPGNPGPFYRKVGFEYTGEMIGERDHVMKMSLAPQSSSLA
jgi:diamine N-acetyltransferase